MINFSKIIGFDWDDGNIEKNWIKHKVSFKECEEIFFNEPLLILDDIKHSQKEYRYFALGKTNNNKLTHNNNFFMATSRLWFYSPYEASAS